MLSFLSSLYTSIDALGLFVKHVVMVEEPFGKVKDLVWRVEMQLRGSPHIHSLWWRRITRTPKQQAYTIHILHVIPWRNPSLHFWLKMRTGAVRRAVDTSLHSDPDPEVLHPALIVVAVHTVQVPADMVKRYPVISSHGRFVTTIFVWRTDRRLMGERACDRPE